jgi:hypothetical protein
VPEVVEAQHSKLGLGPEQVIVLGAAALGRIRSRFGVPAALLTADVDVALDDSGASKRATQHAFERDVRSHHLAFLVREKELGLRRALQSLLQVRHELARDRDVSVRRSPGLNYSGRTAQFCGKSVSI